MKFAPPIPSLAPADAGAGVTSRFTLEHGSFAGRAYTATPRICPNPCCRCEAVDFVCQPDPEPHGPEAAVLVSPAPLRFDLNVCRRAVNP